MIAANRTSPFQHLWLIAQIAAVVVTIFGFAPKEWIAAVFSTAETPGNLGFFSGVDFRHIAVASGVALFAVSMYVRHHRRAITPAAAAPVLEDTDDFSHKPSIAVLPFVNLSSDPEKEFFADGMTEDIITGLSCDSRLNVTARNSTFVYKGKPVDIRAVGKELGVRYVLEGSIRPAGERLRITVQLIEAASGNHVWADKIDRPAAEIFDVMDEVTDGLVTALCSNLGAAEAQRAGRARPENIQAWALCVQAENLIVTRRTVDALLESERLARRATEIEPGYAASWSTLAYLASLKIAWGLSADLAGDSQAALALAGKALSLAPNDPVVLAYCGYAATWSGQAARGVAYLERSISINPNNSLARVTYGAAFILNGKIQDALAQLQRFIRRSPRDTSIGLAYFYVTFVYLLMDDFIEAESAARMCVGYMPGFPWVWLVHAISLAALGREAEAAQQMAELHRLSPGWTRRHVEDFWNHVVLDKLQAEKMIALTRMAWGD